MQATPEMREFLFRYDPLLPLDAASDGPRPFGPVVRERVSFGSINQMRVPALLTYSPTAPRPLPVLLIQHGVNQSKDDERLGTLAADWATHGFACITSDAPLHGERGSGGDFDLVGMLSLPYEGLRYVVQSTVDLRRTIDFVAARPDLDERRVGYVGFSMSAILGVPFVAMEPRARAACLAFGGAGLFHFVTSRAAPEVRADVQLVADLIDPLHYAPLIAPRPVLQVNSDTDAVIPAALGHMLHSALSQPKSMLWYSGTHGEAPEHVFREMRLFLEGTLAG